MASDSFSSLAVNPAQVSHGSPGGSAGQVGSVHEDKPATQSGPVPTEVSAQPKSGVQAVGAAPVPGEDPSKVRHPEQATEEQVLQAVERINEMLRNGSNKLKFEIDKDAGLTVVKVMDAESDELIRQIPSEESLKFARYVEELTGLIFNDQA